jgi:hypothetical protein
MRRTPGQIDQLFLDWGATGVQADLGVRVIDNSGATTIARTTGFVEFPAGTGLYYLDPFTFPDVRGSYTLLYDDDAGVGAPGHTATEDLEISSTAGDPFTGDTYISADELARILKIRAPSPEQTAALERVLIAATHEINEEIDREDDDPVTGAETSLAEQVCLQRATELWHLQEVPLGLAGLGSEFGATHLARNSWDKYAYTLAPLKRQWGFA